MSGHISSKRRDSFLGRIREFSRSAPDATTVASPEAGRGGQSADASLNSAFGIIDNKNSILSASGASSSSTGGNGNSGARLLPNEWLRLGSAYADFTPPSLPREEYVAIIEVIVLVLLWL